MKKFNKKKFIVRIIELLVIIATIILTIKAIAYATAIRGYKGYGGEYLVPVLGLLIILIIEDWYQESEKKKMKTEEQIKEEIRNIKNI